jgi:hypothetical protein
MIRVYLATLLNFFLPGLGNLVLGRRLLVGVLWIVGMVGLTYVELTLQSQGSALYWPMFTSVFLVNTGFAIDTFRVRRAQVEEAPLPA